jgi:hypothetical protein
LIAELFDTLYYMRPGTRWHSGTVQSARLNRELRDFRHFIQIPPTQDGAIFMPNSSPPTSAADECVETIAEQTADLLRDLPVANRRIVTLEALLQPFADCAVLLTWP